MQTEIEAMFISQWQDEDATGEAPFAISLLAVPVLILADVLDRDDLLVLRRVEHDDALRAAAGDADVVAPGMRIIWPPSVTSMIWSCRSTGKEATSVPFRSLTAIATMPLPPRPVMRYSYDDVRLP